VSEAWLKVKAERVVHRMAYALPLEVGLQLVALRHLDSVLMKDVVVSRIDPRWADRWMPAEGGCVPCRIPAARIAPAS